jgi:uncharacterized protein (TIGR02147 family)
MNTMAKHLQQVFMERCRSNEQYSLRAFARSLSVPVSSLSEIMNEKRPISNKLREKIGTALNMTAEQIHAFDEKARFDSVRERLEADYRQLALDSFYIISEWYHYGILQLLKTKAFKTKPAWISKRLGITENEASVALERLIRIGILVEEKNGTFTDVTGGKTSHLKSGFTNEQLKSFQIKALEKGIQSLKTVPIELRDNTSMTLAISKKALSFAKEEIKKFRQQLTKKLEAFAEPDEVYQLAISLSPLTNVLENKEH